jgi:hypothetical protein
VRLQLIDILCHFFCLQALAFLRGQRGFQVFFGCSLVAAFAFAIKIHGRGMQADGCRRSLGRTGRTAIILARQFLEAKLLLAAAFPQKVCFQRPGFGLRLLHESRQPTFKLQQHVG